MRSEKTIGGRTSDAGNSRTASQLIAYEDSNILIAGHARFRGCA